MGSEDRLGAELKDTLNFVEPKGGNTVASEGSVAASKRNGKMNCLVGWQAALIAQFGEDVLLAWQLVSCGGSCLCRRAQASAQLSALSCMEQKEAGCQFCAS